MSLALPLGLSALATLLWQASLLFAVAFLVDSLLARWIWPNVRRALWGLFLLRLLVPVAPFTLLPRAAYDRAIALPLEGLASSTLSGTLVLAWIGGAIAWGLLLAITSRRLGERIHSRRESLEPHVLQAAERAGRLLGLRRTPPLRMTEGSSSPALFFRTVLLPRETIARMSEQELRHALLHELAHHRRGDAWWLVAANIVRVAFWFFPPAHWARRRIEALNELCCDATVAHALGAEADEYRESLLACAWRTHGEAEALPAFLSRDGGIVSRLRELERGSWRRMHAYRWIAPAVLILGALWLLPSGPAAEEWNARRVRVQSIEAARANIAAAASGQRVSCYTLRTAAQLLSSEKADFAPRSADQPTPERTSR